MIPEEIKLPGDIAAAELVADRRGSRIWKVTLSDWRVLALKYATDNMEEQGVQGPARLLAAREAAVLALIDRNGYLFASGDIEAGTWLAVTWDDSPTLLDRWKGARVSTEASARTPALVATWLAADALAELHVRQWRHADLQSADILVPDSGRARLIDFALAQGPGVVLPEVAYRGALAHLTAPEIAREILATPPEHHVTLTAEAEVYMFGGMLFATWAKQWPRAYPTSDPKQLTVPQIHAVICDPGSRRSMPAGWPPMADLLASMLAQFPGDRPSMYEVQSGLSDQMGGRV